ncbi:MAG: lamin tail domain-containing protein [Nannocystaceae bacterium]
MTTPAPTSRANSRGRVTGLRLSASALLALALACGGDDAVTETDSASTSDSDADTAGPASCVAALSPGALAITEIMANPTGADDGREWIELHNPTPVPVSLEGVRVILSKVSGDSPEQTVLPAGLEIPPGGYVTLGNVEDAATLDFIDHGYGDDLGDMTNTSGLITVRCDDVELDAVAYESEKEGSSYSLNGALPQDPVVNDDVAAWCRSTAASPNFLSGDLATPGQANALCPAAPGNCYEDLVERPLAAPGPGDLVITEFMANPEGTDAGREWIELQATADVDLNELELGKSGAVVQTFYPADEQLECVRLSAGDVILLAQGTDSALNGGLPEPDLVFKSSVSLANSDGSLYVGHAGEVVDLIEYTSVTEGAATALAPDKIDAASNDAADVGGDWCLASTPYGEGGSGSPGATNPPCGQCLDDDTMAPRDPVLPEVGDLIITEVMANPAGTDTEREWFEVLVTRTVDLKGVGLGKLPGRPEEFVGEGAQTCQQATAGSYLVFAHLAPDPDAPDANGGLAVVDHLFELSLGNTTGALYLSLGATTLDGVTYTGSTDGAAAALSGANLEVDLNGDDDVVDPIDDAFWCPATAGYGVGGLGTPGAPNGVCGQCIGADDQPRDPVPPKPGDLVITEFLANPSVPEDKGEWFEVYVKNSVDLIGLGVGELADDTDLLANPSGSCLEVQAGAYLVFARSDQPGENGGLPTVDHVFDFSLGNTGANAITLVHGADLIDTISYSASQAEDVSRSYPPKPPDAGMNDLADDAPWCPMPDGTPGVENPPCN